MGDGKRPVILFDSEREDNNSCHIDELGLTVSVS
jgi:hypothetical protein